MIKQISAAKHTSGVSRQGEQFGARMSEQYERTPVLPSEFMVVLDHSAAPSRDNQVNLSKEAADEERGAVL